MEVVDMAFPLRTLIPTGHHAPAKKQKPCVCRACRARLCRQACRLNHLLGSANVRGLLTLGAGRHVEADALTFLEGLETLRLNCGEVGEEIFAAALGSDEAETLGVVEPFNSASSHVLNILEKE